MFESILFIKITNFFFFFIMSQENDNTIETSDFVVETEQGDHILQPDIIENIQDAYDQIIENIGGKRNREDGEDEVEERPVRARIESTESEDSDSGFESEFYSIFNNYVEYEEETDSSEYEFSKEFKNMQNHDSEEDDEE